MMLKLCTFQLYLQNLQNDFARECKQARASSSMQDENLN